MQPRRVRALNTKIANGSVRTVATYAGLVAATSVNGPDERLRRSPLRIANANTRSPVAMSTLWLHLYSVAARFCVCDLVVSLAPPESATSFTIRYCILPVPSTFNLADVVLKPSQENVKL